MTFKLTKNDKRKLFSEFLDYLESRKSKEQQVPVTIFSGKLTPFESLAKYLVDELGFSCSKAGIILRRDRQVVWTTLKRARRKQPRPFRLKAGDTLVPLSAFPSESLSIFEALVVYLKDHLGMKLSEVARILNKDARTIWTIYHRAMRKDAVSK